jgi:ABC-type multidrug transport system ATPase subunit
VGLSLERFPADQPFTVLDYVTRAARIRGLRPTAAHQAAQGWIERLGLAPFAGTRLGSVSKGTAQKVGLAQALLTPPGLLVLDEPAEGLDPTTRDLLPEIVLDRAASGSIVLVSDHLDELTRLPGARRLRVGGGQVTVEDQPDEPYVIEVAATARTAAAAVAALRAAGHDILRVRPERAP